METSSKGWKDFTSQEQEEKLVAVVQLLKTHGLGKIKPIIREEVGFWLKERTQSRNISLNVTGNIFKTDAEKAQNFQSEAESTVLAGLDSNGVYISITEEFLIGDPFVPIQGIIDIDTQDEATIQHKQGQILLIGFWETSYQDSEEPISHYQKMLEQNGAAWGDKIRIIGINMSSTAAELVKHVKDKGWTSVQHYWKGESSFEKDYVVGMPWVYLIDTLGKIAFVGGPDSPFLEKAIERLLKGESLQDESSEEAGRFTEMDVSKISEQMDNIEKKAAKLADNEDLAPIASMLNGCYVEWVRKTRFDEASNKFFTNYVSNLSLNGPESSVIPIKAEFENFFASLEGLFKIGYWETKAE